MRTVLSAPPGCSGAKSVMSQTWLSTAIQQSEGVLCADICVAERRGRSSSAIFATEIPEILNNLKSGIVICEIYFDR